MERDAATFWRIDSSVLNAAEVQLLPPKEFRRQLFATMDGATNAWTPFIRGPYTRPPMHEWRVLRAAVFKRDDYTCTYCGARGVRLECDHIVPVARGGQHGMENLTTACRDCNRAKRSKTVEEWLG